MTTQRKQRDKNQVIPFKCINPEVKEKATKQVKTVDGIPYICYELEPNVWACEGEVDPKFRPEIPSGALKGDLSKQRFCVTCHKPKFYYVDTPFKCQKCQKEIFFRASEQKYWYEELKFHFHSFPKECVECRRELRKVQNILHQKNLRTL